MKIPFSAWIKYHGEGLGIVITFGASIAMLLIVAALFFFPGPSSKETGVVTGFGMRESETGSYRVMHISFGRFSDTVRARSHLDCRVGDTVTVSRTKYWWGYLHNLGLAQAKPCARPQTPAPFRN
ncbi:MAG: hypothetical protein EON91_03555 [Brevundimonas sp.]|uniref:hypothetical protein n=1 Tax=Brevundimonas sp. TaxID=1871086 RepID=UPI001216CBFB|nr:hypothetical protein [Brevundimonas sp.]RZJ18846.1 MAG: hypothetical protein EON91_03555 [Brevundimonas sp.]